MRFSRSTLLTEVEAIAAELREHAIACPARLRFEQADGVLIVSYWNGIAQARLALTCAAPQAQQILSVGGFTGRQWMWRYADCLRDALRREYANHPYIAA